MVANPFSLKYLFFLLGLIGLSACQQGPKEKQYLFLGHIYDWQAKDNNRVDPRIEALNKSPYSGIWLGGDICARSSEKASTVAYLDQLFHISSPNTHWAFGNHDLTSGDMNRLMEKTRRPSFYTTSFDKICLLVLNTNFNHPQLPKYPPVCDQLDAQYQLFQSITDTINQSDYLVILHHHALLTNEIAQGQVDVDTLFHFYRPKLAFSCQPEGSFQELAYPLLEKVQKRGVQVIMVGGDVGQRCKTFQYQSSEGIWFLGSGINNSMGTKYIPAWVTNLGPDSILVFRHDLVDGRLDWKFDSLEAMLKK